ncbi:hypothetical protein D1872_284170 [compost metagenome]
MSGPVRITGRLAHLGQPLAAERDNTRIRLHNSADQMKQRAFSGTAGPGDRDFIALVDVPFGNIKNRNRFSRYLKLFPNFTKFQHAYPPSK